MTSSSFIVVETKNGRATPSGVWEASSEQDYCQRVAASNPRSGDDFEDFQATIKSDEERHAMRVEILKKADFQIILLENEFPEDQIDDRILKTAERLGWYTRPESTE